jgi:putative DNA primase/helicase
MHNRRPLMSRGIPRRTLLSARGESTQPTATDWLWEDKVALCELSMLAGPMGQGKSTIAMDLCARVSTCAMWPGKVGPSLEGPASVFVVSAEDKISSTLLPRYMAAGGDIRKFRFLTTVKTKDGKLQWLSLQEHIPPLEKALLEIGDVRLMVLDPITSYLGRADGNSNTDVRNVLAQLNALAERCRMAVLCITHESKRQGVDMLTKVLGSALVQKFPEPTTGCGFTAHRTQPIVGRKELCTRAHSSAPALAPAYRESNRPYMDTRA